MALPPIISNFPLFKLFRTDNAAKAKAKKEAVKTTQPQDVVSNRLEGTRKLKEKEVPAVAAQTREQLASSGVSLGLDPKFS